MRKRNSFSIFKIFLLTGLVTVSAAASGPKKLVLVGGGDRPVNLMAQYGKWAGGKEAKVLIIGWSSTIPDEYFKTISADLRAHGLVNFDKSLTGPKSKSRADVQAFTKDFLTKLDGATAVFFAGGDQTRHMDVIRLPGIREALEAKYAAGFVFGGTSAGTAIMSKWMLTGKGAEVDRGLGLLPESILVDQHGSRDGRVERLLKAMGDKEIPHGLLIYDGNGFTLFDDQKLTVYGEEWVKHFAADEDGAIHEEILRRLDRVELGHDWKVIQRCEGTLFSP